MKLTRLEAIEQHRDMWNRIYKYCNERYDSKTVPNAKEIKRIILKEMSGGNMPAVHSDCYLCEYAHPEGCQKCPLEWGILCYVKGGLFEQFCQAKNYKEAAYFAFRIRDLRERIERDERETPMMGLKNNGYERCIQKLGEIEDIKKMIQNRIKELKNSRAGYMVCGISCNHAVVAELERLLKEIEENE